MAGGASAYGPDDKEAETEHDTRGMSLRRQERGAISRGRRKQTTDYIHTSRVSSVYTQQ